MTQTDKIFQLSEAFSLYKSDFKEKKYYLFNVSDGTIYKLNEVSYDMLSQFDGVQTVGDVLQFLLNFYDVQVQEIESDLNEKINQWLNKKILVEGHKICRK